MILDVCKLCCVNAPLCLNLHWKEAFSGVHRAVSEDTHLIE